MALDGAQFRSWVGQAARAPSAHTTQPARWRMTNAGIELHEDPMRWLSAGDRTARDQRVALGMAWEALRLAASADGWRLAEPTFDDVAWPAPNATLRRVARAAIEPDAEADPLAAWQARRHCWRGKFASADATARAAVLGVVRAHGDVALTLPEAATRALADIYDRAAASILADAPTARELYQWLRFSRRDTRWMRDGLSADCLALGIFEARIASWLMRPNSLVWLRRCGLLSLLVSERAKTLSATCLVLIHADADASPFVVGRAWYRCWLGLTAAGFAAVPMSALVDEPQAREELVRLTALPPERIVCNVMRVGILPNSTVPVSARLPTEDLILATTNA